MSLDQLPVWAIYLLTVGLVLPTAGMVFALGVRLRHDPSFLQGSMPLAEVAGLLGLLGFLLAFSIGIAVNHFDTRGLVVADANAIGTSYLRTSFLGGPDRTQARDLQRVRRSAPGCCGQPGWAEACRRSEEIHDHLWSIVEVQSSQSPDGGGQVVLRTPSIICWRSGPRGQIGRPAVRSAPTDRPPGVFNA